jgi:tRNA threonylcarbamoyladenosine biosynthesis protein TsaE
MEIITTTASETKNLGKQTALDLLKRIKNKESSAPEGHVIALTGDLGSGKTTFIQGFAEGLGITSRLVSPTFILMRQYPFELGRLYHLDVYRLERNAKEEAKEVGLIEIMSDSSNIIVIEWAEKIKELLPKSTKWISFEYLSDESRKITFN